MLGYIIQLERVMCKRKIKHKEYGKNGKNERKSERSNKISSFDERTVGEDGDKERVKGIPNKAYS